MLVERELRSSSAMSRLMQLRGLHHGLVQARGCVLADGSVASMRSHERHRLACSKMKHRVAASTLVDRHRMETAQESHGRRSDHLMRPAEQSDDTDANSFEAVHEPAARADALSGEADGDEEEEDEAAAEVGTRGEATVDAQTARRAQTMRRTRRRLLRLHRRCCCCLLP